MSASNVIYLRLVPRAPRATRAPALPELGPALRPSEPALLLGLFALALLLAPQAPVLVAWLVRL